MDDLLEQMSLLADQAGDWKDHLPYAAAVGFLEDSKYRERYGAHVDGCQYCRQLVDALHPGEQTLAKLLSPADEMPPGNDVSSDVADAVAEARWNLDSIRGVILADHHGARHGTLRKWARAQRWLVHANQSLEGPDSAALAPWKATVALWLDTHHNPKSPEFGSHQFRDVVEEAASLLLAFGFRVAHAGDPRSGGISERICNLAHQFGRRKVPTDPKQDSEDAEQITFGVTEYCAWPVHINMPLDEFETCEANFGRSGIVQWLTLTGEPRPYSHFFGTLRREPAAEEWDMGFSALRNTLVSQSLARIAMGGGTGIGHGAMPSLAQDALISLRSQHPVYVLGGFGGCARGIAAALRLTDMYSTELGNWGSLDEFSPYIGAECLHNGLDASENRMLAETADVEEAMGLVLQGLDRVAAQKLNPL